MYGAHKHKFVIRVAIFMSCLSLSFMQPVLFVDAQVPGAADAPKTDAPVDIQAAEQEFADDQVIAKGNVVVTYKESIVHAPLARLFRDASGQAQRAVFIGHPNLIQGANKINADTLIFEIANSKVVAQGHAHSEVISSGDDSAADLTTGKPGAGGAKPGKKPAGSTTGATKVASAPPPPTKIGANGVPQIQWPKAGDEQAAKPAPQPAPTPVATATTSSDSTSAVEHIDPNAPQVDSNGNPIGTVDEFGASANRTQKKNAPGGSAEPVEKIITDSDYQEYEKAAGKFDAIGNVHVIHGDISVYANKLQLVYGLDGKPETALFTGAVNATQGTNNTKSDMMTYYLATKRLQATGNVRSKVIQNKPVDDKDKKPGDKDRGGKDTKVVGAVPKSNGGAANATPKPTGSQTASKPATKEEDILVLSDAQDYSKDSGRMAADGNVHVYYEETTGMGPHVILLKDEFGKAQTIIFTGRSQIAQPGKKWIADKITFNVATKKVLAEGNTKAFLVSQTNDKHATSGATTSTTGTVATSPKPSGASDSATGSSAAKTSISASKAEETR